MTDPCPHCGVKHRVRTADQCADRSMSEATLQSRVMSRARRQKWKVAHAGKAFVGADDAGGGHWITPMSKGWPDLVLAKAGHRLIFMELKKEEGEVDEEQWVWLRLLLLTGNYAIIVRPSDLREGRVTAILREGAPL